MDWVRVDRDTPLDKEVALAYSPVEGIGLVRYYRDSPPRWVWLHKRVNGVAVIADITHWCRIYLPPHEAA